MTKTKVLQKKSVDDLEIGRKIWYDEFRTWEGLRNDVYSTRNHGRIIRKLNSRRKGLERNSRGCWWIFEVVKSDSMM